MLVAVGCGSTEADADDGRPRFQSGLHVLELLHSLKVRKIQGHDVHVLSIIRESFIRYSTNKLHSNTD